VLEELSKLWKFRELLKEMVRRELKARYRNSVLGFLWSLLNPLATVMVLSLVFSFTQPNAIGSYSAYVLAAYLPYLFFQSAVLDATSSVLNGMAMIKKVYFPREILPLASVISNFIHFGFAMIVFFLYLLVAYIRFPGVNPFQATTIYLPALVCINFILALGAGFLFAALNTFYEDVKYIVNVALSLLFFASPIMYFVEQLAGRGRVYTIFNAINPIGVLSNAYRKILLAPQAVPDGRGHYLWIPLDWRFVGLSAGEATLLLIVGYTYFNRVKWRFVERP
jgi:lipopolysaccharide transport system permease protein